MTPDQTTPDATGEPWCNLHREHYPTGLIAYFAVEARATAVEQYQRKVVPAVLQHPDYTEANLRQYAGTETDEMIDRTRKVRALRRAAFLGGDVEASFVLHASVLRNVIGSPEIMRTQHAWLQQLDSTGRASIKILEIDEEEGEQEGSFTFFTVANEVFAFDGMDADISKTDDDRRNELIMVFGGLRQRAVPLRDYLS